MDTSRESAFRFYSFGIVMIDKERKSDLIKVLPQEELSISDGVIRDFSTEGKGKVKYKEKSDTKLLSDQKIKYDVKVADHQGVDRVQKVEGDVMIVAKWIPLGQSNRITSPDVIKGETVMLFRVSDTDEYYWTPLMREPGIRRQETVLYAFGNLPTGLEAWDKDTSYWFEVSTHDKYAHLHTAKNDGEPFEYDVKLDTQAGVMTITDNAGNSIVLDSTNNKLTITTNVDVEVNTQNVVVNASEKVDVNTKTATVNASEGVNINTPITKISDDVEIGGNVKIGGAVEIGQGLSTGASGSGNTKIGGEIKIEGDVQGQGDIDVSGNIHAGGSIHGSNI